MQRGIFLSYASEEIDDLEFDTTRQEMKPLITFCLFILETP